MKEIMTNAENRKDVVKALADHLGERAVYAGPPSFAYQIGNITVDREGKVILEDESRMEESTALLTERRFLGNHEETEDSHTGIQIPIGELGQGELAGIGQSALCGLVFSFLSKSVTLTE